MNPSELTDEHLRGLGRAETGLGGRFHPSIMMALTPLTGRDTEVDLLTDRWEQAQEGSGQVVLISGEAGLGKSRLVATIRQLVLDQAGIDGAEFGPASPVIEWRCSQRFQNTGLHPVAEHLSRLLEFDREPSTAGRFDRLAQYLEGYDLGRPELVALFAKLLFLPPDERFPAPGLPPIREREETFRALRTWLQACAHRQPILFAIEDLHWMDASSLEFLAQFVAGSFDDRILTVVTFRPEFQPTWRPLGHQTSLALNRFTKRQVGELMRKEVGRALPDSLIAQIYQRTRGVPLLVEEFTRMVRESATSSGPARDTELPATLQHLVTGRLDRMSSNFEVVQYAATLGREFPYDLLAAVVKVDEATLQTELAKLTEAEILHTKGQPPNCAYLFKHALLEEALHNTLDELQRQQFHRQVAEVMERQFPLSAETQPELIAQHFTEAGLVEKAAEYWLRAGRRSHERFANVEAISHLTRGLDLLGSVEESPTRDARELELLGPLGTAYIAARGYAAPEVGPIFHRARALAERGGATPQTFAMMRGHFAYHIVRGDFRLCTTLAGQAMEFAEKLGDPGILMEALFLEGLTKLYRGDFAGAHACCTRALTDFDDRTRTAFWATQTGEDSGVTHRCYLALASWHLGFPDRALAQNREALELARSLHHPFSLEYALHHTGWLHQHCRLGPQTQASGDEEMGIATEQGFLFWHASGSLFSGAGLLLRGRLEEGLALFQSGLQAYRSSGAGLGLPYYLSILGAAFTEAGRFDDARRAFEEALALGEKNGESFQEAEIHRLWGELHLAESKDEGAAATCFGRALVTARNQGSRAWELRATISLARLWHRQGRQNEAYAALTTILGAFTEGRKTPDLVEAAALLKELGNERMRDDIAAGIKYVRGCIPPPMNGPVAVDWRYVPSSTLGGDTIGYHWVDEAHLAFYLIDVTGHGMDSALLAVTVTNVIRSGSVSGADLRRPEEVLAALNNSFQGSQHGSKYFTIWYGVYRTTDRTLTYASGGHPAAVVLTPGVSDPLFLSATGPVMGIVRGMQFPAYAYPIAANARLFIFSDGVFEIRRDQQMVWDLPGCIQKIATLSQHPGAIMDELLAHARSLRGAPHLDDDFSIIEARFG